MSKTHKSISKSMIRAIQAGIIAGSLGAFLPLAMALPGGGVSSTASMVGRFQVYKIRQP